MSEALGVFLLDERIEVVGVGAQGQRRWAEVQSRVARTGEVFGEGITQDFGDVFHGCS